MNLPFSAHSVSLFAVVGGLQILMSIYVLSWAVSQCFLYWLLELRFCITFSSDRQGGRWEYEEIGVCAGALWLDANG